MGKRKKRANALSEDDEELLWRRGVLGDENPTILNHTIWFLLSQQFGTRGIQEHTQMYLEDFKFVTFPQNDTIKYMSGQKDLPRHAMAV